MEGIGKTGSSHKRKFSIVYSEISIQYYQYTGIRTPDELIIFQEKHLTNPQFSVEIPRPKQVVLSKDPN